MIKKFLSILLLLLVITGCGNKEEEKEVVDTPVVDVKQEEEPRKDLLTIDKQIAYRDLWNKNHDINSDYIGQVFFESELLNLPVTYSGDNDYYLRRNFETLEYDIYGTVFEDFNCKYDSQNTILYGHYVDTAYDPNGDTIMFSPLAKLMKQENYEDNKIVYLLLENELREYEVVSVFYCDLYQENGLWYPNSNLVYYYSDYEKTYFERYKYAINEAEFYDTGVDFEYTDRFLTLQTCVEAREDLREIVLCKQINTYYYE